MAKTDTLLTADEIEEARLAADLIAHADQLQAQCTIVLTPEQTDFMESDSKGFDEVLFSGGVGSGKSLSLCLKLLDYVSISGATVALIRQNYTDLKRTTLRLLLYGETQKDGSWRPPLLPPQAIKSHNKIDGVIELWNGSVIMLLGVADEEKVRSLNCAACFVEELSQITKESYLQITMRPRQFHPMGNRTFSCTNPPWQGMGHWIYKYFVSERVATRKMLCVSSESNPYLPEGYTDRLQNLDEDTKKRMLRGEWSNVACGVFTHFNRSLHVASCKHLMNPESCPEIVIGQDLGGGAKWAGHVVIGKGFDNKIYCFAEWMVKNITHQQALTWMEPYRAITGGVVVYDSANAVAKNEMTNHGWKCIDSIKNIEGSIAVMNNLFAQNAVVIDPSCEVLIAQLEEAYRNPETGHVAKWRDWDVLDAYRYSAYHLSNEAHEKEDGLNYFMVF